MRQVYEQVAAASEYSSVSRLINYVYRLLGSAATPSLIGVKRIDVGWKDSFVRQITAKIAECCCFQHQLSQLDRAIHVAIDSYPIQGATRKHPTTLLKT